MQREFKREQVRSWFEEWDEVRNENDIIGNHIVGTRRPDRVMIKGNKADDGIFVRAKLIIGASKPATAPETGPR